MIIIPARLKSERFPRKMLADIAGKPLIVRTVEAAVRVGFPVVVATDSLEIADVVDGRCPVIRTPDAANGTERCLFAAPEDWGGPIINWQGDSPFLPTGLIWDLAQAIYDGAAVASAYTIGNEPVQAFLTGDFALDFSRTHTTGFHHLGVYAFTRPALVAYCERGQTQREWSEGLEQLRWQKIGFNIRMVRSEESTIAGLEVNETNDVAGVARHFQ